MTPDTCAHCGATYTPKRSVQKYCSPACGYDAKRKPRESWPPPSRPCVICAQEYEPASTNQKYCSDKCRERAKYHSLKSDPDRYAQYLKRMRDRYVPSGKPPGPAPKQRWCGVAGCSERHLAKGMCKKHWRRDRRARGLEGRPKDIQLVGALRKNFDPVTGELDQDSVTSTKIMVHVVSPDFGLALCPECKLPMRFSTPEIPFAYMELWSCGRCAVAARLNEEEFAWVISEKRSTAQSERTSKS